PALQARDHARLARGPLSEVRCVAPPVGGVPVLDLRFALHALRPSDRARCGLPLGPGGAPMSITGTVVVVGAGGNIGSHAVPHLGRMAGVRRVVLIDRDVYEKK